MLSLEFLKASLAYLNTHLTVKNGEFEPSKDEAQIIFYFCLKQEKTLRMIQEYNTKMKQLEGNLENSGCEVKNETILLTPKTEDA